MRLRSLLFTVVVVVVVAGCDSGTTALNPGEDAIDLGDAPTFEIIDDDTVAGDVKGFDTAEPGDVVVPPQDVSDHGDTGVPDDAAQEADIAPSDDAVTVEDAFGLDDVSAPDDVATPSPDTGEDPPPSEAEALCVETDGIWDTLAEVCDCLGGRVWTPSGCVGPESPGPLTWQRNRFDLQLSGGLFGTTLTLRIYIPYGAGPFPVVVFLHGYQLGPDDYRSYAERLASWGYVVVMPQMPGGLTNHKTLTEHLVAVLNWIDADAANAQGELKGQANPSVLGLAGHSLGGKISMLVASEDTRPDAIFGVDPVDSVGNPLAVNPANWPRVIPDRIRNIAVPLGLVGETVDATCSGFLCQACAPEGENFQAYFQHAVSPAVEITVLGANHMSFLDNPNCGILCSVCNGRSDDPAVTRALTQKYMVAFFELHLRGDAAFRDVLAGAALQADEDAGLVTADWKNGF